MRPYGTTQILVGADGPGEAVEAAVAGEEVVEGFGEVFGLKIGPHARGEEEFGVGAFPEAAPPVRMSRPTSGTVSTDKRIGITNEPSRPDDPTYIVRLMGQAIRVSLETVKIVRSLPPLGLPTDN